ncbi:MAG: FAD-dependent oxidoreductase [Victivallaceae bacterium]|nr:FAD-dependent oxidoreductase [Victivallaceae bacterium]
MNKQEEFEYKKSFVIKVIDKVDVLVVGGGSAGVTAALAAARSGADVLLLESSGTLGGMMTSGNAGLTNSIVHHNNQRLQREVVDKLYENPGEVQIAGGLPLEIITRLLKEGHATGTGDTAGSYVFASQVEFKWLLLDMMEEANVKVVFHAFAVDIIMEDSKIKGVIIESKAGRQVISAKIIIDATGDGDIACKAGCPFVVGIGRKDQAYISDPKCLGKMGALGVMYRVANVDLKKCLDYFKENREHFQVQMLALYSLEDVCRHFEKDEMVCFTVKVGEFSLQVYNSPIEGVVTLCCPCWDGNGLSLEDLTRSEFEMRTVIRRQLKHIRQIPGFDKCKIIDCPNIGVRETRHIQGEYILTIEDVLAGKDFHDSIGRGAHTIDVPHVPEKLKSQALPHNWCFHIPYRCLIPKNSTNLLMAGRCASYTHEAFGCARTTVQCMITGEAAGTAAGICSRQNLLPRELDTKTLRNELLKENVLL